MLLFLKSTLNNLQLKLFWKINTEYYFEERRNFTSKY